jgi:hypothetical protein
MKVIGIDHLSNEQLNEELRKGGRFVLYQYCISILVMSFKRSSNVYFVPAGQSGVGKGVPYTLISLVAGWWGIPWGPIWTLGTAFSNLRGGTDVTSQVVRPAAAEAAIPQAPGARGA